MKLVNNQDYLEAGELFESSLVLSKSYDREHYSPSFLKQWSQCPAKGILDIIFEKKSPALEIGSKVHELLEDYYKNNMTEEQLLELCKSENLNMEFFDACRVKEYIKSYLTIPDYINNLKDAQHLTEEQIVLDVSPMGVALPVKLKGIIDRIDIINGIYVVDYKTTSRRITNDMYLHQMIIYKWLVEERIGSEIDGIYIAAIHKDSSEYIKQNISLTNQSKLIDKIFEIDEEVIDSIDTRCYKKKRGDHCKWCPLKDNCSDKLILEVKE